MQLKVLAITFVFWVIPTLSSLENDSDKLIFKINIVTFSSTKQDSININMQLQVLPTKSN